jgi:hypothetical protein
LACIFGDVEDGLDRVAVLSKKFDDEICIDHAHIPLEDGMPPGDCDGVRRRI